MSHIERIPLLADHHSHPSVYGALRSCPDLRGVTAKPEALQRLAESPDEVVFGLGWSDTAYSLEASDLESLPPTFVCNTSLHTFRLNQAARELFEPAYPEIMAGIDDPEWVELNLPAILAFLAEARGCDAERLNRFYDGLLELGIWSAQEMAMPGQWFVETVEQAGLTDRTRFWVDPAIYQGLDEATREKIIGIKLFTDGALGARTAAMREPLLSGERGILLRSDEEFRDALNAAAATGKSVAMHAVGDRALDQLLDTVEFARTSGLEFPEMRAEHCQFLTTDTAARARDLGITLSMQPNFSSETNDYADRLSSELCQRNNPFRMLIDDFSFVPGVDLILGSDGMPHGAAFALQMSLFPPLATQQLTLEEFVEGYCMPDFSNGHVEIEIDEDARTVSVAAVQTTSTNS
jgi:predicted amidohydrolase YtcJ